jgi:hypothetical protein
MLKQTEAEAKGGEKLCQRRFVNEPLLVTKFALNLNCEGATFIQRGLDSGLFGRIWALKLTRHRVLPNISKPPSFGVSLVQRTWFNLSHRRSLAGGRATVTVRWVARQCCRLCRPKSRRKANPFDTPSDERVLQAPN